jgi:hypothetical protein
MLLGQKALLIGEDRSRRVFGRESHFDPLRKSIDHPCRDAKRSLSVLILRSITLSALNWSALPRQARTLPDFCQQLPRDELHALIGHPHLPA